ncbi:MAG: gliding motility-associated C-terminal domain-containing protein [Flavobacteriales bacterium]|nr:gliding motility-associated C-terminal domain-containing protein [Flavobacteriales bacterium]
MPFSPNDDGVNDLFLPLLADRIEIYPLTSGYLTVGEPRFSKRQTPPGWMGTFRSQKLPQGAYIYALLLRYRDDFKEDETTVSGEITLVR